MERRLLRHAPGLRMTMCSAVSTRSFYRRGREVALAEFLHEDYRPFYETWKDSETQRNFNSRHEDEGYEYFLANFTNPDRPPQRFNATIVNLQDQTPIGRSSLAPAHREPDLGIWIYEQYRFQGYGTEAVRLSVDYIFRELGLNYIVAGIYEHNQPSINLFTKVGFTRVPQLDKVEESVFGEGKITQLAFRIDNPSHF